MLPTKLSTLEEAKKFIFDLKWQVKKSDEAHILCLLSEAELLGQQHNDYEIISRVNRLFTDYYIDCKQFDLAIEKNEIAMSIAKEHQLTKLHIHSFGSRLHIYHLLGDFYTAQLYIHEYIDLVEQSKNDFLSAIAYTIVGQHYKGLNQKKQCIDSYKKAIKHALKTDNIKSIGYAYASYANDLVYFDELEEAETINNKILENSIATNFIYGICQCKINLGIIYRRQKKYNEASEFLLDAIKYKETTIIPTDYLLAQIEYVLLLLETNRLDDALQYVNLLENDKDLMKAKKYQLQLLDIKHQLFAKLNNHEKAYSCLNQFQSLKETIFNETSDKRIQNLEITHQVQQIKKEKKFAENMAKLKHDFLANMSHEIRTPINNIMGLSFLLQEEQEKNKQQQFAHRIHKSAQNLLDLINDILDISKIEAGKFDLNEQIFSLSQLIDNIKSIVYLRAEEKGLVFTINNQIKDDYFNGDAVRIQQILINIIANAIKFTSKGSVLFNIYQNEKNEIIFDIKDTGIGIEDDKIQTIFDAYEQASSSIKTTFGGTGLGLSIAKKLVDKMKGTIIVNSEKDKGTIFQIILPLISVEKNIEDKSTKTKTIRYRETK
jgi:signal transduction histidine kinase